MYENTCGRVTFLVDLMFGRLDKFDGLIFGGRGGGEHIFGGGGGYIWDVNWVTYLGGVHIPGGDLYSGGISKGFYGM